MVGSGAGAGASTAGAASGGGAAGAGTAGATDWKPMSLEELERLHVERVLKYTGGNKKKAAEILGIERCTLYAKIKGYGL